MKITETETSWSVPVNLWLIFVIKIRTSPFSLINANSWHDNFDMTAVLSGSCWSPKERRKNKEEEKKIHDSCVNDYRKCGRTQPPWSVGAQGALGRISPIWENSPKWEIKIWVQIGDFLPNGRTLFNKALCRLRGTFAGDKNMFNGFLGSNYPSSPSTSKFHRLLIE